MLTITNQFGIKLTETKVDLFEFIKNPITTISDKTLIPQFQFITIKEGGEYIRDRTNYDTIEAITLDIDKGITIGKAVKILKKYKFYLFTSFNNTRECHKFRIILPLNKAVNYNDIASKLFKEIFFNQFNFVDQSSFSNFQKMPCVNPERPDCYFYHFNEGIFFDSFLDQMFLEYSKKIELQAMVKIEKEQEYERARKLFKCNSNGGKERYKSKVLDNITVKLYEIPRVECGYRYTALQPIIGNISRVRYPAELGQEYIFNEYEIKSLILCHTDDSAVEKMIEDFLLANR